MAILEFNLSVDQGADLYQQWTWSVGDDNLPVLPVPMAGCTATMHIFVDATDVAPLVAISTTPNAQGSVTLGAANGIVQAHVLAVATAALPLNRVTFGLYQYRLFITFPSGQPVLFAFGTVSVTSEGP